MDSTEGSDDLVPPLKRDPRLRSLSSDHHHALVLARRASRAAAQGTQAAVGRAWGDVLETFSRDLSLHFQAEEEVLLPALEAAGEERLVKRTIEDHGKIRACVAAEGEDERERLGRFAKLLETHARFEERTLFEVAQKVLGASALEAVETAAHRGR